MLFRSGIAVDLALIGIGGHRDRPLGDGEIGADIGDVVIRVGGTSDRACPYWSAAAAVKLVV